MTSRDFCYWLQGFFEIADAKELNVRQTEDVRRHLALVFRHEIDPSMGDVAHQASLSVIHSGAPTTPSPAPVVEHHHHNHGEPLIRC